MSGLATGANKQRNYCLDLTAALDSARESQWGRRAYHSTCSESWIENYIRPFKNFVEACIDSLGAFFTHFRDASTQALPFADEIERNNRPQVDILKLFQYYAASSEDRYR